MPATTEARHIFWPVLAAADELVAALPIGDVRWPPHIYRPVDKQEIPEYVEPFDVQADWDERA